MKILFLDIDGVLNSINSFKDGTANPMDKFCPITVSNLNFILESVPNLKIVISSTWRIIHSLDNIKKIFANHNVDTDRFIGITPILDTGRGLEIQDWLKCFVGDLPHTFVIVDDDSDMEPFMNRLVKTNHDVGLTRANADEIIKRLLT